MGKISIVHRIKELKIIITDKAVSLNSDHTKTPNERYELSMEIRGHHKELNKLREEFKL